MKKLILPSVLGLVFAACDSKSDFVPPPPPPVTVTHPSVRDVVVYNEAPATLTGLAEVDVRARVRGFLESRLFKDGERIEAGQKLFTIERGPFEAAVNAAKANLKSAEAARNLAVAKLDRLKKANQSNSGAVSALDVEIGSAEVDQAEAQVSQMQALLEDAEINLSYTTIVAPTTGRLSRALVDEGNLVDGGEGTLLAHLTNDEKVRAYFEAPERDMLHFLERRAQDGVKLEGLDPVRLVLADGTVYEHLGKIDFIDSRVDPGTRTATVRAEFPNPEAKLASGLYALVGYPQKFPNPVDPNAVIVPAVSILRDLAGEFVWVVDEQNVVHRRGVRTGATVPAETIDANLVPMQDILVLEGLTK
ncbi:MAG: efflux RND transporter periplasmic adaptor subunit, partial [Verrucomicrobiales bacterium]